MIDLDALARDAARLEPLPVSVTRLATLVCDGEPALTHIVELVGYDQALTATLLRTANSSWSASRTEITTVKDAVVRLGAGPVLSLALAANVRARMGGAIPEYGLGEQDLWSHSVAASLAAELLARVAQHRPPPEAATAALLHDTKDGAIACAVHLADVAAKAVGAGMDDNPDVDAYVRAMGELGITPDGFDETCRLVSARFVEVKARFS